ncbi:hypothetical protein AX16_002611 [Volvariella volvacea WC 439]|nr:hypothetical protein AX16_002611 [Volvariella volvacea WC 439]
MSSSTHYIRSIHTQFTARSTAWAASSPSMPHHPHYTWGPSQNSQTYYLAHSKLHQGAPASYSGGMGYYDAVRRGDWRNVSGSPYTHSRRRPQRLHSTDREYYLSVSKAFNHYPQSPSHALPPSQGRTTPLILPYRKTTFDPFFDEPLETTMTTQSPTTSSTLEPPSSSEKVIPTQAPAEPVVHRNRPPTPIQKPIHTSPAPIQPTVVLPPKDPHPVAAKVSKQCHAQQPEDQNEAATTSSTSSPSTPSPRLSASDAQKERDARARLVAGILLNKIHAVGKPMRRRPCLGAPPREYVKSNLSNSIVPCSA